MIRVRTSPLRPEGIDDRVRDDGKDGRDDGTKEGIRRGGAGRVEGICP